MRNLLGLRLRANQPEHSTKNNQSGANCPCNTLTPKTNPGEKDEFHVDEIENDEEGIAELLMDDNAIANVARPGTSLKKPPTAVSGGPTAAMR